MRSETNRHYTRNGKKVDRQRMVIHPQITAALKSATIVITGGTTNGYVAEEILASIGSKETFPRMHFFRGTTTPPGYTFPKIEDRYMGDVVIIRGVWQKGKTIAEAAESLKEGDLIIKGANAVDLNRRQAAVLIGNPNGGTIMHAIQASIGKRVGLIFPVVSKRGFTATLMLWQPKSTLREGSDYV